MALRLTEEEYAEFMRRVSPDYANGALQSSVLRNKPKPPKYGNRRVEVDGIKFDSQHEANVYAELMMRKRAGEIKAVLRQVPFDLPGGIRYFADFCIINNDNTLEVLDAKSEATRKNRVYINKKKQVKACLNIDIQEV